MDLGSELGEPRSAATAVAPAPHGAGADAGHESTAGGGAEGRAPLQEAVMAGQWTPATGVLAVGALVQPATARAAGVTGSIEPDDRGVKPGDQARSGEVSGGTASDDPSRSRCPHRPGLRADHREGGALWLRQTGGKLSRPGAVRKIQRESAATGAHHQTGKFAGAFLDVPQSPPIPAGFF